MKHKKQHYIPQSYLESWCDPDTPDRQTPYVWQFTKDGANVRKKAPSNIFYEKDMYTIKLTDGSRSLILEQGLSELESKFCNIRRTKLENESELSIFDRIIICGFIAAMHARTKAQSNHLSQQWGEALKKMEMMMKWAEQASPQEKFAMADTSINHGREGGGLSYEEVKKLASEPIKHMLLPMITVETPELCKLDFAVIQTTSTPGFITSDAPCVWFDPEACKRPPFDQTPGLIYPTIEITLPISPNQMILLNRSAINGYLPLTVDERLVDELNRRTRFHAHEHFIVNKSVKKEIWFDPCIETMDSWRKTHKNAEDD